MDKIWWQITFRVKSIDKNFLLSPMSMALLMIGSSLFTASSMGTGGTFSPPAVMISSEWREGTLTLRLFMTQNRDNGVVSSAQNNMRSGVGSFLLWALFAQIALPFILPVMYKKPSSSTFPRSPECSHPSSSKASLVLSSTLRKPMKMLRPQKQISPVPSESTLAILYRQPGTTLPQLCQRKEFFLLFYIH